MFLQWCRDELVLSFIFVQHFSFVGQEAASERHHCRNTNVGGKCINKLDMKTIIRLSFFLTLVTTSSCDNFSTRETISPIIATDLPSTSTVGETITFKIYHVVFNGCGQYSRQESTRDGKVITVKFYGKYPNGKICPDNIPTLETNYNFEVTEKGDYYFRFYQDNYDGQEFILDTLKVQ
jgi:hypothetical protein